MTTVAELLIESLADHGVHTVWGVVGDALNPVTDAIRREERIDWVGVRHEEVGAFAAGAQAQLTGRLGVCMGTVGPGALHLLNGLYDAAKSHAPVLAICGQVPREEIGSDFFQEVDNDVVFADVAVFNRTVTSVDQLPALVEQAVNAALAEQGVAVLSFPGDVGGLDLPRHTPVPRFVDQQPQVTPTAASVRAAADAVNAADKVTLLVGLGSRDAREEVLALADHVAAPMVLTLKAKDGFEEDNPFEIGQSGLLGNRATKVAFDDCDVLVMLGTDFPYRDFLPSGKTVVQLDLRGGHIGRRTAVDHALVGDTRLGLRELLPTARREARPHPPRQGPRGVRRLARGPGPARRPEHERSGKGLLRRKVDNPDGLVPPEVLAAAVDRHADGDAVFTSDTGMATVWLSRFVRMTGTRRLSAPTTWGRWPTRCRRPSGRRPSTGTARSWRSAGTVGCRCSWATSSRPCPTTCRSSWWSSTTAGSGW